MKVLDVALKDLLRSTRNMLFWVFGFVVPFLTAGLFYFAFGGVASGSGFELPTTRVQLANLDEPVVQFGGLSVGQIVVDVLKSDELADILLVTPAGDAASARAAVDAQEADVAVIIPADFTSAALQPGASATVELYQDPTLTLGPGIVKGIINQLVDGFVGSKIAAGVAQDQLGEHGFTLSPAEVQSLAMQYAEWAGAMGETMQNGSNPLLEVRPAGDEGAASDTRVTVISMIMGGMMVFYVFFTGAASAQAILQEDEVGTLPRLFTTPTTQATILGGKFVATFVTLLVEIVVLVAVSAAVFGINWGEVLPVAVVLLGTVALSGSFGIFITSFLKGTRQGGVVYGGVMTMMGMLGMMDIFTAGAGDPPKLMTTIGLMVPQGWAVRGWQTLLKGGGLSDVVGLTLVMLAMSVLFFAVGVLKFRKRFA